MKNSMRQENRYDALVRAPASARKEVTQGLYDEHYGNRLHKATQFPAPADQVSAEPLGSEKCAFGGK